MLRFSLHNKLFTFALFFSGFLITIGALRGGIIQSTFFPSIARDFVNAAIEMPAGTNDSITNANLQKIELAAQKVNDALKIQRPDSLNVIMRMNRKLGPESHEGTIEFILLDNETRNMEAERIADMIRDSLEVIPNTEKLVFSTSSPFGKPVSVSLLGNDLDELERAKQEFVDELKKIAALKDITTNDDKGLKEVKIRLKEEKAQQLGVDLLTLASQVRQGFFGNEVQRLQRGIDEVKVWVRYSEDDRSSLEKLEDMRIRLPNGAEYPFRELAYFEIERDLIAINRLNGKRSIKVEAELALDGETSSDVVTQVSDSIVPEILAKYDGISVAYEGEKEESQKSQTSMMATLPFIGIIMLTIITWTFRSFFQALIVFLMVLFGFIGVGWGHWLHGLPISLLSFFGIIALLGIMVNDSLVLVSNFNERMKSGERFMDAVYNAGMSRFRAIILTSVTTIAGLAPLILERSFQAQFLVPMAVAVAYGLAVATFVTLILLPVFLVALNDARVLLIWLWTGRKPTQESCEPAVIEKKSDLALKNKDENADHKKGIADHHGTIA